MEKEIRCFGCGALLQNTDKNKPGYVPGSINEDDHLLCQRCFKLMHYHQKMESHMSKDDFLSVLQTIGEKNCLVVYIIDLFDFNGSMISGLMRHISYNDVLVLANKRDILPLSLKETKLNHWVRRQLKEEGIKPLDVIITSGKKNMNFDEIYDAIDSYRKGRDVYVVGMTNVGKSTFINGLLKHYANAKDFITTSEFPGTTLDLIRIPLDAHASIYDSPGIVNDHQMTSLVDDKTLKMIMPQGEVRAMVFQLNPGQTLYFDGLARIDFKKGEKGSFVCYFSKNLKIHRTKTENADALYNRHQELKNTVAGVETIDQMKTFEFSLPAQKTEIAIAGLGFLSIDTTGGLVEVKVPESIDVIMRESLI